MKRLYLLLFTFLLPVVSWATEYYSANSKGGGNFHDEIWTLSSDGSGTLVDTTGIFTLSNNFTILSGHSVSCPSTELDIGDLTIKGTLTEFIVSLNDININNLIVEGTINFAENGIDGNFNVVNYFALDGSSVTFSNSTMNYNVSGYFYIGTTSSFSYNNSAENKISGNGRFDEFVNPLVSIISDKGIVYSNDQVVSSNLSDFPTAFLSEEATIQLNKDHTLTIDQTLPSDLVFSAGYLTTASNNGSIVFSTNASGTFKTVNSNTNPFNDITVNTSNTITLGGDFYMGGELTLTDGIISGNSNRFVINSGGSINGANYSTNLSGISSGGSDESHINGQMSMTFATTGNFTLLPVGDGTSLREAGVKNRTAANPHTLTIIYNNSAHSSREDVDSALSGDVTVSNVEYWDISVVSTDLSTNTFKTVLSYNANSGIDETKPGTLHLMHYSLSEWGSEAYFDAVDHSDIEVEFKGGTGYIAASATSFSPFTFGGGDDHDLPVTLTKFDAEIKNEVVELSWSTATEINNSHFEIERSTDQNNWNSIGEIEAKGGNSSYKIDYTFEDDNPLLNAYYRLVQYDFDGGSEIFGPIHIDKTTFGNDFYAELHPNILFRNQSTKLALEGMIEGMDITIQVYDHHGNLVVDKTIEHTNSTTLLQEFNLPGNLPSGMYHLNVSSGSKISRSKFVLQ
ncbi:T9SS type A sorting domain-containing protein [Flammeovirga pacifica]|uniref:Secretion system C-terminal sorting domain-containing protein n=1 Tax=Flammeovirga pacifica TaxID=915059 RepID=A0A1S1Z0Y9_FLAPC|nr:T9SS type A sorting domain-containing protein [Flammeovirga pacifica]OHX66930.1 hypothetical protein NH26_11530 [Flammeovirga pacifica]